MENKEIFLSICSKIKRDGIDKLLEYLEKSDFYYCPASTKFHGNYAGGLLEHSINVYDEYNRLKSVYPDIDISDESIAIITLFHDLCKVNMYGTESRNRKKEDGTWEAYSAYTHDEKFHYGGHGSKSVFIIQQYIKLTAEEAVAINCHMSCWDGNKDVGVAYEQFPSAWLLHVADESATYMKEGKNNAR